MPWKIMVHLEKLLSFCLANLYYYLKNSTSFPLLRTRSMVSIKWVEIATTGQSKADIKIQYNALRSPVFPQKALLRHSSATSNPRSTFIWLTDIIASSPGLKISSSKGKRTAEDCHLFHSIRAIYLCSWLLASLATCWVVFALIRCSKSNSWLPFSNCIFKIQFLI